MHRRALALTLAILAAVAGALVVAHDAVAGMVVRAVLGGMGYGLSSARLRLTPSSLDVVRPVLTNRSGEPVLTADRLDVRFSIPDLVFGGRARYGLRAIDLERPRLTLIHNADGTYNVSLPSRSTAARPDKTPFNLRIRVRDGQIAFVDRFIDPGHERRQSLVGLAVDAVLAPTDPSYYRVDAALVDGSGRYPIAGRARFDHARRYASQHWWAPLLPIGALVDFGLQNHAANVVDGRLRGLDLRAYGFMQPDGTTDTHLGATASLEHGKVFAQALVLPIGDAHGPLQMNGDGLTTTGIDATLAGTPLHLVGGVYDLSKPTLRFLVTGSGPLARLKTIARAAAKRPLAGDVTLALRADGPLRTPVVRGTFASQRFVYEKYALRDVRGTVSFTGEAFDVVAVHARYGALDVLGSGRLDLGKQVRSDLVVALDGPSGAVPYAGALVPRTTLDGVVMVRGLDSSLGAAGELAARGAGTSLDAPFDVAPNGVGTVGPLALERADGARVYARLAVDRPHDTLAGVVAAHRLTLASNGLRGALDADLAIDVRGRDLADAAGSLHVRNAAFGALALGDVDATLAGNGTEAGISMLRVRGPLADVDARGAFAGTTVAAEGRVRTTFDRVAPLLHASLPVHGAIDAPFRLLADASRKVVQVDGARFAGASLRGIPLQAASATIALRGNAVDVPAALLDAGGGTLVARGSLGDGGTLLASASGIGVNGGTLVALAAAHGTLRAPSASFDAALAGANYGGAPLDAVAYGSYAGTTLHVDDALVTLGGANAEAQGTVAGLGPGGGSPRVDVQAHARGLEVATLAKLGHLALKHPDASLDADLRVAGTMPDPAVSGSARIPNGSLNGLAFRDVVVPLHGTLAALTVSGGRATVGSTTLRFDARTSGSRARIALAAPHLNLADFNDYFDTAETFAGKGRGAATVTVGPNTLASSGSLALAGTRFRRFPVGDVAARWSTRGRTIAANASVGGSAGRLTASGTATVPAVAPLRRLSRSDLNVTARLAGLELGTWLPTLGMQAPITGRLDGVAHVQGAAPYLGLSGDLALTNGIVDRIPIRTARLVAVAERGRARIATAQLQALNLTASASGTFGFLPASPIDLSLHASSPDIAAFARQATGKPVDFGGALDTTLRVQGTRSAPVLAEVLDVTNPTYRGATAQRLHVDLGYAAKRLTLRDASLDFPKGSLALSGTVPATTTPPFVDRRDAAIALRAVARKLDVAQLAALFPHGTQIGGTLDGDVRVAGTFADPSLNGTMGLTGGSYVSPFLTSQLHNATLQVALAGHAARITKLHGDMGGGAVDGTGSASVGDLRALQQTLAFSLHTREKHLGVEAPPLFKSAIDGTFDVTRAAGGPMQVGGDLAFSGARLSAIALLPKGNRKTTPPPFPIAFNLRVAATKDDRVQGPMVDVGAQGSALLGGTLAAPTLRGRFISTDGTVTLYRTFFIDRAAVAFNPADGILPNVNVTATTHVPDPSTDVLLHIHGPATQMALDLTSRPDYDKAQIIGLLAGAQALGAVPGVASTGGVISGAGISGLPESLALGVVNTELTRSLFQPFSASLANALDLSSFEFAPSLSGGFSLNLMRKLGRFANFTFSEEQTQNGTRQAVGISANLRHATALQLTLYGAGGSANAIGATPFLQSHLSAQPNLQLDAVLPPAGSSGFVFSLVHKFWTAADRIPTAQQARSESAPPKTKTAVGDLGVP